MKTVGRGNAMKHTIGKLFAIAAAALLSACAVNPPTITQGPATARPQPVPVQPANGAIFQTASYRPLFEDRRARMVGDILTIAITEKTNAAASNGKTASKTGALSANSPQIFGMPTSTVNMLGLSVNNATKLEEKDARTAGNTFSGTIAATVIEVLPNGNLVVSGEKQIAFDKGSEFVRFSGVVSPDTIGSGNVVPSTQVADARVEYRSNTHFDRSDFASILARFFLSVLPM